MPHLPSPAPSVLVAVCTRHRNDLLTGCLRSLSALSPVAGWDLALSVVDNSADRTAAPVVDSFASTAGTVVHYLHEPRQGIPFARNAVLRFAIEHHHDYLAFIDDDEVASPGWIAALLRRAKPDLILHGRVAKELPPETSPWIKEMVGQQKKNKEDGSLLSYCATDNILIPLGVVAKHQLFFDERHPLAGGTDVSFTAAARTLGIRIMQCNDALVTEIVARDRLEMSWLRRRKYRAGIDVGRQKSKKPRAVVSAVLQIVLRGVVYGVASLSFQAKAKHKAQLRIYRSAGVIRGALGGRVDSYARR